MQSPESRVIDLLLSDASVAHDVHPTSGEISSPTVASIHTPMSGFPYDPSLISNPLTESGRSGVVQTDLSQNCIQEISSLLLRGQREAAAQAAMARDQWPLALIIGGVCEKEFYQLIVRSYAEKHIGSSQGADSRSLQLMCLVFSNQAEGMLRYGGRSLSSTSAGATTSSSTISQEWRRMVVAVLANKSSDWTALLRLVASRLIVEAEVCSVI